MALIRHCVVCGAGSHRETWIKTNGDFVACDWHTDVEINNAVDGRRKAVGLRSAAIERHIGELQDVVRNTQGDARVKAQQELDYYVEKHPVEAAAEGVAQKQAVPPKPPAAPPLTPTPPPVTTPPPAPAPPIPPAYVKPVEQEPYVVTPPAPGSTT
jgi:uncharacterized membrane protein